MDLVPVYTAHHLIDGVEVWSYEMRPRERWTVVGNSFRLPSDLTEQRFRPISEVLAPLLHDADLTLKFAGRIANPQVGNADSAPETDARS